MTTLNSGLTRSNTRMFDTSRAARAATAGAANSAQLVRVSAPMAFSWSLARVTPRLMAWRRSTGSSMLVASDTSMAVTWLPIEPRSPLVRTDIGTIATRDDSGSSPFSDRYRRSAPAQTASTTSLTVPPSAFFTIFTSSRDTSAKAKRRWGVMEVFNEVRGALNGAGGGTAPGRRLRRRRLRAVVIVRRTALAAASGWRESEYSAHPTSSKSEGILSGCHGGSGGGTTTGSGWRSSRLTVSSSPDTPSMAAWWVLVTTETRPPSNP